MTKTIEDINLDTWFVDRELSWKPDHFTNCNTPAIGEARSWILEKLRGRFTFMTGDRGGFGEFCPAFEDPKEAVFYELTWG